MSQRTCNWCGRLYDDKQAFRGGVKGYQWYCSKRCENAANRNQQEEMARADAARNEAAGKLKGIIKSMWK